MLTDKPYVSMPLPESRDAVVACENCCKPLGTMAMQATHLSGGPEVELPLADEEEATLADDVPCKCDCGARYCCQACSNMAAPAHALLCSGRSKAAADALIKFESHAMETEELFLFAARFVACAIAAGSQGLELFASLCRVPFWELSDEGIEKTREEKREVREECDTSRKLLLAVLAAPPHKVNASAWLTPEAYAGLLGAIRRNAILVELSHPLRDLLPMLHEWRRCQPASSANGKAVGAMLDALPKPLPECLWSAVYPKISCVNHSCMHNAEVQWFDESHEGTLVATRDIRKGEEIFISYIPDHVQADTVHARRASLRDYGFECDCQKCSVEASWQRRLRPRRTLCEDYM